MVFLEPFKVTLGGNSLGDRWKGKKDRGLLEKVVAKVGMEVEGGCTNIVTAEVGIGEKGKNLEE